MFENGGAGSIGIKDAVWQSRTSIEEDNMSQKQEVLNHLKTGAHITPLEAIGLYGIYRLAARIFELRSEGHNITTDVQQDRRGRPYSRYRLAA